MTHTSTPIVFFGTEDFSLYSLKALVESKFNVVAVITKPDTKRGRGHALTKPRVKIYAEEHDIPVWQPEKLSEISESIKALDHPAGVLVSFGKIIPKSIIDLFRPGIINVHPSLLPEYRGPSPIESAIINRDARTGVTIMQLEKAMDAGPIYTQAPYALDQTETRPELYETLGQLGANILVQKLPAILDGSLPPIPQDHSLATYCNILTKSDGSIVPSSITPGDAEAKVRAYLGFPRTRMQLLGHDVIVTKAHAVMTQKTPLDVECANGAFLSIDELVAPSGKTMNAEAFLRGYLQT
jgi:methionyl-tRNA formyltransferase